jgi:hypothetical protein
MQKISYFYRNFWRIKLLKNNPKILTKKLKIMKSAFLKLTALLLIVAGIFSCEKPPVDDPKPEPKPNEYQKDISFTEYSLEGIQCKWKNLNYDDKVIIINSKEELEQYIGCTSGTYNDIDFAKNTLLLASGKTVNNFLRISKNLQRVSSNEYELNVEITRTTTVVDREWSVALVTEKLSERSTVKVNTNYKEFGDSSSIYYVVGYLPSCGVITQGETAKAKVYLLAPENLQYLLITRIFPNVILDFPTTIVFYSSCIGHRYFPKEYHFSYHVQMTYRPMTDEEYQGSVYSVSCSGHTMEPSCHNIWPPHYNYGYIPAKPVVTISISKFELNYEISMSLIKY